MLWAIPTKLGHNNNEHLPFMSHDLEGSKGHAGVTGLKIWFYYKTFQLQQKASNRDEIVAHELSLACAQKLNLKLNSKVIKGHFRVNSKIFSKNHKKSMEGARIILQAQMTQKKILNKSRWPLTPKVNFKGHFRSNSQNAPIDHWKWIWR